MSNHKNSILQINRSDYNLDNITEEITNLLTDLLQGDIDEFMVEQYPKGE